jgi:class 3 adenylate cyclase/tetratricopeptide (TPR) repeat protein
VVGRVETLTVLFTDLVDSTALRVRVGEEQADRVRLTHDRAVSGAIEGNGGQIVKHTGDGYLATFDGASDGIRAAVAIQQAIDARNQRDDNELRVRVGLSAGDVTLENGDCFGLPVVEAQRLESAATPGQILCSSLVRALARGRGDHEFRSVGALDLKGLSEPLAADEVLWARGAQRTSADRLPPVLAQLGGFGFAGREAERAAVTAEWERAIAGETRVALLAGEPGVGKTRLVAEVARELLDRGATVLGGRCDELIAAPYQPFVEALRVQLRADGASAELGPLAHELSRLASEVNDVVPGLAAPLAADPEAERRKLFDAVRGWLDANATSGLVLVLDDLHWADLGSLLLLRHIMLSDPIPRLLVIGTYRDTDLDRTHPLSGMLVDFRRAFDITRVALEGLDEGGVIELVTAAAGHTLDAAGLQLAQSLHDETDGNAFFVSEVLRHLGESGAVTRRDGQWVAGEAAEGFALPEGVRDVVGRRLTMLPQASQDALATAAVIGPTFALDVLAAVAGNDEDAVLGQLEPALHAHLVVETGVGTYRFAHALVRSTLHQELSSTRRSRMHRRVANTLEARSRDDLTIETASALAYHWSEANAAGAPEEALVYSQRAAELATAAAAPAEAAHWYRHSLELLDGEGDRRLTAELMAALGEAERLAGVAGSRETLLQAAVLAEELGDIELMAKALSVSRRSSFDQSQPEDREWMALLERALAQSAGLDAPTRVALLATLATETIYTGDTERKARLCEEATELLDSIEDFSIRFRLLARVSRTRSWADDTSVLRRSGGFNEDAERAWNDPDPLIRLESSLGMLYNAVALGDGEVMHKALERFRTLATIGHPAIDDSLLIGEAEVAIVEGRLDDLAELAEQLHRTLTAHNMPEVETYYSSIQIQLARERGFLGLVANTIVDLAAERYAPGVPAIVPALAALALVEGGRTDEAIEILEERGGNGFADIPDDAALYIARATWAEVAARVAHVPSAEALSPILEQDPDLHAFTGGWYLGSQRYYLGLLADTLGHPTQAITWFEQAVHAHERIGAPAWIARALIEWAAVEQRSGNAGRAGELVQQALDAIGDLPLDAVRARAEALQ